MAEGMQLLTAESRTQFGIAIDEAVLNAIFHGNLELTEDELKEVRGRLSDGEPIEVLEKRLADSKYKERDVHFQAILNSDFVEVIIRDYGSGFDHVSASSDGTNRGLTLIRSHVDEVSFNEAGNEIRLVKLREKAAAKAV